MSIEIGDTEHNQRTLLRIVSLRGAGPWKRSMMTMSVLYKFHTLI